MNLAEPSFFQTIISFIMNLLIAIVFFVLSFFGISTEGVEVFGSSSPVPAYEEPAASTVVAGEIAQSSGDLVNAAWLSTQLDDPNLRIVAVAPTSDFQTGHIPGSSQVGYSVFDITDTSAAGLGTWESKISSTMTALGITPDSTVVVYDYGTHYSPRLWWVLKQFEQANVYVLDGGYQSWVSTSLDVETGLPQTPSPSAPYDASPDLSATADISSVQAAIGSSDTAIVDARSPEEYAAGHIPGAINIPFTDNYAADGTLLDIDALTTLYASQGVTPDLAVIVYCSTGVRAASDVFALEYLAYPDVSLYLGSYNEWSADPSLPIEK
ncbi:3-mercaptopyruvate sulfurtransferase [soil metagenome]